MLLTIMLNSGNLLSVPKLNIFFYSMKEKQIYIVADTIDSNLLVERNINSETIVTLTPDAFYVLKDSDNNFIRSNELFTNAEHEIVAKTVKEQE